jgi:hypothetical protein
LLGNIVFQTGNIRCFLGAEIIKELQKQQRPFVSQTIPPQTGFFFLFCCFFLREKDGSASASRNVVALTPLRSLTLSMDTRELTADTERVNF